MPTGYRVAMDADRAEILRTLTLCFGLGEKDAARAVERAGLDDIRVWKAASAVAAITFFVPMGIFFGGRSIRNLGIAAVGIPPEHRGRGLSIRMMQAVLQEGRERGFAVATLHPAAQTVYRKVGFREFGAYHEVRLPLATIGVRDRRADLARYAAQDRDEVMALQKRAASLIDGHLDRGPYVWQGVFAHRGQPADGYLIREGGALTGYCFVIQRSSSGNKYDLHLTDAVATTPVAARRLLTFLADHRSLGEQAIWHGGPTDPLLMEMPEDRYTFRRRHFVMMRILDVKKALEARGYPRHVTLRLEQSVEDEAFETVGGPWRLEIESGYGTVTRGGGAALRTDARGLASLVGQLAPARQLRALGLLDGDDDAIDAATTIFGGPQSHLTEMF